MTRADHRLIAAAAVLATSIFLLGIGRTDLWPPDETRVAEISREMLDGGPWLLPHLNGQPFIEEPPLFYWLQAATFHSSGSASSEAARLPAATAAALGVLVTAVLALLLHGSGGIAALVLATTPEYWWMARSGTPDTAATAATALALTLFFVAWKTGRLVALAGAVGAAGVAFWLKSLLGPGLAVVTLLVFLALAGTGRLRGRQLGIAAVGLGVVLASWIVALSRTQGGDALSFFLVTNHLGRVVGYPEVGHLRPALYYAYNLALDLLPWSIALPAALVAAWRRRRDSDRLFPLLWAVCMTVVLSLSATKRAHYLLPAYPGFAVLIALWWQDEEQSGFDRATRRALGATALCALPVVAFALLLLDPAAIMRGESIPHLLLDALRRSVAHPAPWIAAGGIAFLGLLFRSAQRAQRPARAALTLAASCAVIQLVIALRLLPQFNAFCSARPWGEQLGRAARGGASVVTFGFPNREVVSPFLFHARRLIPEVRDAPQLESILRRRSACAVVRADAYAQLAPALDDLPATPATVGGLRFVLVSDRSGGCERGRD